MNYSTGDYAMGAGSLASSIGSALAAHAATQAIKKGLATQQAYANQAMGVFNSGLPGWTADTAMRQIAEGAAKRNAEYASAQRVPSSVFATPQPGVRDQAAVQMANQRMANLSGYKDWQLEQDINRIKTQEKLNQIISFAGGQARILPEQIRNAQHSFDWLQTLGNQGMQWGPTYDLWSFLKEQQKQPQQSLWANSGSMNW